MADVVSRHLDIQPRCGACRDTVFENQRVVALFGTDFSAYLGSTRIFSFPKSYVKVGNFYLCRKSLCQTSNPAAQTVVVHHECLSIFTSECSLEHNDALERLWVVGAWRNPWPRAYPLQLASNCELSRDALTRVVNIYGLPELAALPAELLDIIREYSPQNLLWEAASVLTLAACLSATKPEPAQTIALTDIARWERGGEIELWEAEAEAEPDLGSPILPSIPVPGVLRFTLDATGIKMVERLPDRPPYLRDRAESLAFIVEEVSALSKVKACFKDGLLQLRPPPDFPTLRIWDTPAPPSLSQCVIFADKKRPWRQFRTAELSSISGITFFYWHGLLVGLHPHRPRDSNAESTYRRLSSRHRQDTVWMYLPISEQDKILILGARPTQLGLNILVRKRLTGDTILGSNTAAMAADSWRKKEPTTLIWGEPPDGGHLPFLGTYCHHSSRSNADPRARNGTREPRFAPHGPRATHHGSHELTYFSSAPLRNVAAVDVFYQYDPASPSSSPTLPPDADLMLEATCQGMVIHYENGGSRALGNIRMGIDARRTVLKPTSLCFGYKFLGFRDTGGHTNRRPGPRRDLRLRFTAGPHEDHDLPFAFTCFPAEGELWFWFNDGEAFLAVMERA